MRPDHFSVSVPGTSANLGPGFDAVGIALNVRMHARITPAPRFSLQFTANEHAPTHDGLATLILGAFDRITTRRPKIAIEIDNAIPLGKGLGSSAAATALGCAIAAQATQATSTREHLADLVCAVEGHPDNALPAIYGGIIIAANARSFMRIVAKPTLRIFITVPELDFATIKARAVLPAQYKQDDVVFTAQHAALLGAALASGNYAMLADAMRDRVHQPYRAQHMPGVAHALELTHRDLYGIALSGAGPSVIAFVRNRANASLSQRIEACFTEAGVLSRTLSLRPTPRGLVYAP